MRQRALGLAIALLLLGACGGGGDDGAGASATAAAPGAGGAGEVAESDSLIVAAVAAQSTRAIVYTADVSVEVTGVEDAASSALTTAEEAGGFLETQEVSAEDGRATVTVRVPSEGFHTTLAALLDLGTVHDQSVATEDRTPEVIDLEARLASARASVERVRQFMERAANVPELVTVEAELSAREALVESLAAQLAGLEDRVSLATITLRFSEEAQPSDDIPGFLRGVRYGWLALVNVGAVLLTVLGAAVPWLPVVALALGPAVAIRRRRRRAVA